MLLTFIVLRGKFRSPYPDSSAQQLQVLAAHSYQCSVSVCLLKHIDAGVCSDRARRFSNWFFINTVAKWFTETGQIITVTG